MIDIALLVEGKYVQPKEIDWYVEQVLQEEQMIIEAFSKLGLKAEKVDWSLKGHDWSQYKLVLFRSVWDYFHKIEAFYRFLEEAKGQSVFVNTLEQIKWNTDKHYLKELEEKGIPIVESYFLEKGDHRTLEEIHLELGLERSVIKPCISGAARHTYLLEPINYEAHESVYREVISNEAMLIQPFLEQVITKGEVSHVVIGGQYSHSVLKKAKEGDYRVQDDFGGTLHDYRASQEEKDFAEKVVEACNPKPMYARVDVVWNNEDEMVIGELELIEPELWFRRNPKAAHTLAQELIKMM